MRKSINVGTNPTYTGKHANKTSSKYGNYGTDTFTRAKRSSRRASKQTLKYEVEA